MNLISTSAGLVMIGLLTLSLTRQPPEGMPPDAGRSLRIGVYDPDALAACGAQADPESLARVAREADLRVISSDIDLAHREPTVELIDVTLPLLRACAHDEAATRR